MLFRAPTVLVTAWFAVSVMAVACPSGKYKNNQNQCLNCPDGSISPSNPPSNGPYSCTKCAAGQTSNSGHSQCQNCTPGNYNNVEGGTCVPCPDGSVNNINGATSCDACPAGQSSNPAHTQCQKCSPGNYNDTPGGTCRPCASGYFNSVSGAKSCCQCCAGYYSNSQATNCNSCPNSRPYSFPGSNDNSDCKSSSNRNGQPNPASSCDMVADNRCPNPTGGGPVGSPIARKKRDMHCTRGLQACPRYAGRGGFECVNTRSDPESCGGCRDLDGKGSGTDCTAMTGVSVTRCVKGSCVIDSCGKGYAKSLDGASCVPVSSAGGSNPEAFNAQEMGAGMKRNSFAKRLARTL